VAGDQSVELTATEEAANLGNVKFTPGRAGRAQKGGLDFNCTILGSKAVLLPFYRDYLESPQWKVFVDGKFVPGRSFAGSRGYAGGQGGDLKVDFTISWNGKLEPGTKFLLALAKPRAPETLEFIFEPPPLPARADGNPK
jgi:hypothetical protein